MPQKTIGQLCYEAYWRSVRDGRVPVAWAKLLPQWRAGWEAAAQAVLEAFVASAVPRPLEDAP